MGGEPIRLHTSVPSAAVPSFSWSATLLLAALSIGMFSQGGFYRAGSIPVGIALAASVLLAHRASTLAPDVLREPVVGVLGVIGVWSVLSAVVAGYAGAGLPVVALTVSMAIVAVLVRRLADVERVTLVRGIVTVGALVALTGWAGVAFRIEPLGRSVQHLWRAEGALTYANALGALVAIVALLALALQTSEHARTSLPAAIALMLAALGSSMSRGAIVAWALGLGVLAWLLGVRAVARALLAPAIGAAIIVASLVPAIPDRTVARPLLGSAGLLVGVVATLVLERARTRARLLAAVASLAALALACVILASQLGSIVDARLTLDSVGRSRASAAALDVALEHPITGAGPGRASLVWMENGRYLTTRYVHNEYLQTLAELGIVGAALVAAVLVASGHALVRRRRSDRALWAGVVAACCALAVHSAMDFLWHIPIFPLLGAALFGLVTTGKEPR